MQPSTQVSTNPLLSVRNPLPVDAAPIGGRLLKTESRPVIRKPRGRHGPVPILKTPLFIFGVELAGLDLALDSLDAPVLDKEGRHVIVLPELLSNILDAGGNLEVTALLEAPQALESPV